MKSYNFTKYESQGPSNDSFISINKAGELTFPSTFCYENKIFSFKYANLFWDGENMAVGIQFTNTENFGSYKLGRNSRGGGARVSSTAFMKTNNIDYKEAYSGRYSWKKYEDENNGLLYVIELKKK